MAAGIVALFQFGKAATLRFGRSPAGALREWRVFVRGELQARFDGVNQPRASPRRQVMRDQRFNRMMCRRSRSEPWAPPTAEQVGLIGTHWSKGWVIEKNTISHSVSSGIALGKHGDEFDNTSKDTAEGYVKTIERALARGWDKETIGHHVVRDNVISNCEQAGIVGSLGAAFSTVTGNTIRDIHVRQLFTGAEMAGIKFHGAIDVVVAHNHIYRTVRGLWLDWMAQGTRVTGNLFHDNPAEDLFMEVDHGPFLVDNNVFLSPRSLLNVSQGGAYVHNLMAGIATLVWEITKANLSWGRIRIANQLKLLGVFLSASTVRNILQRP